MRLSQRSYPHPVLGNRDDVPDAAFQTAFDMTADKQQIYIDTTISSSSATINRMIVNGEACFVLHVECSNTLFRQAYEFKTTSHRVAIPADNLNDVVEVNLFARALKDLSNYRIEGAHAEYGNSGFEIRRGDVLAVAEGKAFHIESEFDSMSRIGSIMQIQESLEEGDNPMRVDFNGEKVVVILSKKDFAEYKLLKSNKNIADALTTTIVLPVLIEALRVLQSESEGNDDPRRWVQTLQRRIDPLPSGDKVDPLILAQTLLELPIKRALASSRMLAEAAS